MSEELEAVKAAAEESVDAILESKLAAFDPAKPLVIGTSEIEGLEYLTGRFVFRRQTVADRIKISVLQAKLRENSDLDAVGENLTFILATFSVVCSEKPKNFLFEDMTELDPLFALYERYAEWLNLFRLAIQRRKEAASGTSKQ